ncbi:MAG: nicotinate phosphoribosyltransferase [Flavobacteriaceae bacterium]|nr:nicotinate phosphoribosyltransferase [Flavobacteriaceae bacterium]
MDWLNNICWLTDSYKVSHWRQYPPGTQRVYSYFESRKGSVHPQTTFFGLQYWLKQYLAGEVVTAEKIDRAETLFNKHFGGKVFNRAGWEHILNKHNGYLPIEIKAVPEGTVVGESNVLMTVENTDDESYWLTNYLETLLVQVWYPSTVATQSREMKKVITNYLTKTGDPSLVDFKLHDFGFRGVTCPEQAAIGGAAHLINFKGTDTIPGVVLANEFYHEDMAGFSIPAAEHSTITSWGREHEVDACRNMLEQYPTGLVATVSDSYDIFNCCANIWGGVLKEQLLARDGVLVVRPDSGDPPTVVIQVLDILGEKFGYTTNAKGFKVLHPKVRVIQGDGIDFKMLDLILDAMMKKGLSADNIAFGSGGGLLQKLNRDTQRFAFKCSDVVIGDKHRDVYKQPVTDGGKKSKAGRLKLVWLKGSLTTVPEIDPRADQMQIVFKNGKILADQTFAEIRERSNEWQPFQDNDTA